MTTGIKRTAEFTKLDDGGWRFTWGHKTFVARRNIAGFAGRDWDLLELVRETPTMERWVFREDQLASRQDCVDAAAEKWSRWQ